MPATAGISTAQFGIIGLGVMGANLALNLEDHGRAIAVWNLETDWVDRLLQENPGKQIIGVHSLQELCRVLERPRRILLMITAGDPIDQTLLKITPYLSPGDIVIDGGNSYFKDTMRRETHLRQTMVHYFGMGVSGGEEGARYGPSLMLGGPRDSYSHLASILQSIAAKSDSGPCVTYVGPDGAGHFVKMVHNGIEYGDMQLIAEAYEILNKALKLSAQELADIFAEWNRGPLESYLIEITSQIFCARDQETGRPLVDLVLDKAGQKGTGKWTAQVALDLGVPVPTITAAIDARATSSMKDERVMASRLIHSAADVTYSGDRRELIQAVHDALYASKICSYAQGMNLIRAGSQEWQWGINLREMARIWKGGCIIRARFLDSIMKAYEKYPELPNLLLDYDFMTWIHKAERAWRKLIATAVEMGIPVPALSASLSYFDSYRSERLPQNLTQAQRDYFGAHTYQRNDRPNSEPMHTNWASLAATHNRNRGEKK
ncbi:MAG TPA: decarboxylating NADP(+)-dependent phosphogluconate dehydrogenase [Candidatus Binatia bacterium]|nr:decarboxylating NADP(+)-dependent phosphogluconate dehydrogenase [Candidatus Binatia bacterium]